MVLDIEAGDDEDFERRFAEALNRITILKSLQLTCLLSEIEKLQRRIISVEAQGIYASKENELKNELIQQESSNKDEGEEKEELALYQSHVEMLHTTYVNHDSYRDTLQNAKIFSQCAEVVRSSLQGVDVDKSAAESSDISEILMNYKENLSVSYELQSVITQIDEENMKKVELQLKLKEKLRHLHSKWEQLYSGEMAARRSNENSELTVFREKVEKRQEKVDILITFLQVFISSSSELWGSNDRLVQALLLCDVASSNMNDRQALDESIRLLYEKRKKSEDVTKRASYVTSTPARK